MSVTRKPEKESYVKFTIGFSPEEVGVDRTKAIMEAVGEVMKRVLTEDEIVDFLDQWESVRAGVAGMSPASD